MPPSPRGLLDGVVLGPTDVVTTARVAEAALSMLPPAARTDVRYRPEIPHMWTRRQLHLLGLMLTPAGSDFHARLLKRMKRREQAITGALVRLDARELVAKGAPLLDLPAELMLSILDKVRAADEGNIVFMLGPRASWPQLPGVASLARTCRALRRGFRDIVFAARLDHARVDDSIFKDSLDALATADDTPFSTACTHDGATHPSSERARWLSGVIRHLGDTLSRQTPLWGPDLTPYVDDIAARLAGSNAASVPSAQRAPLVERFGEEVVSMLSRPFAEMDRLEAPPDLVFDDALKRRVFLRTLRENVPDFLGSDPGCTKAELISVLATGRVAIRPDELPEVVGALLDAVPARRPLTRDDTPGLDASGDMSISPHGWDLVVINLERIAGDHAAVLPSDTKTRIADLVRQRDLD